MLGFAWTIYFLELLFIFVTDGIQKPITWLPHADRKRQISSVQCAKRILKLFPKNFRKLPKIVKNSKTLPEVED